MSEASPVRFETIYSLFSAGTVIVLVAAGNPVILRNIGLAVSGAPFRNVSVTFDSVTSMSARPAIASSDKSMTLSFQFLPQMLILPWSVCLTSLRLLENESTIAMP